MGSGEGAPRRDRARSCHPKAQLRGTGPSLPRPLLTSLLKIPPTQTPTARPPTEAEVLYIDSQELASHLRRRFPPAHARKAAATDPHHTLEVPVFVFNLDRWGAAPGPPCTRACTQQRPGCPPTPFTLLPTLPCYPLNRPPPQPPPPPPPGTSPSWWMSTTMRARWRT
jgi:hypothetical protein